MVTWTWSDFDDPKFGIDSTAERYGWIAFAVFGLISSLFGDSFILLASCQRDAFKINKLIITVIQHIAVADLAVAISTTLTNAISLTANSWVLGDVLCHVAVYMRYMFFPAGMLLIAMLTTSKFLILRYPLRTARLSCLKAHLICSLLWICSATFPILFLVVDKHDIYFDYRIYNCGYGFSSDTWRSSMEIPWKIAGFFLLLVPSIVVIAASIPTLKYLILARRSAKRLKTAATRQSQGGLTVSLTAIVFCISTWPYTIYIIARDIIKEDPPGIFHVKFFRIAHFIGMINIISNFYIYCLTIRSFRKYLRSKLSAVFHLLSCYKVPTRDPMSQDVSNQERAVTLSTFHKSRSRYVKLTQETKL